MAEAADSFHWRFRKSLQYKKAVAKKVKMNKRTHFAVSQCIP